jgi:hypothetical protein
VVARALRLPTIGGAGRSFSLYVRAIAVRRNPVRPRSQPRARDWVFGLPLGVLLSQPRCCAGRQLLWTLTLSATRPSAVATKRGAALPTDSWSTGLPDGSIELSNENSHNRRLARLGPSTTAVRQSSRQPAATVDL